MTEPEFSRPIRIDTLGATPRRLEIEADAAERDALAKRFRLVTIDGLTAELTLSLKNDEVTAVGSVVGAVTQRCVASGTPVAAQVEVPFALAFRPQPDSAGHGEEIELAEAELDTVFYEGGAIDVGEAVAETLALNLDPYPRAPDAADALKAAGVKSEQDSGPFAALSELRDKLGK